MRGMRVHFTVTRAWTKAVLVDAEKERQAGLQGKGQLEPPFKEVLEQIKRSSDMSCDAYSMRRAYYAGKSGDWEGCKEAHRYKGEISEWAFNKVKESYDKVASEHGARHLGRKHGLLKKNHCACIRCGSCDFIIRLPALVV